MVVPDSPLKRLYGLLRLTYIRAVGTFVSRYRIDSLEKIHLYIFIVGILQHRIGGLEKLSVNTPASANVQHRIGGLEIKQNNVTTLQELKLWV